MRCGGRPFRGTTSVVPVGDVVGPRENEWTQVLVHVLPRDTAKTANEDERRLRRCNGCSRCALQARKVLVLFIIFSMVAAVVCDEDFLWTRS